MNDKARAWCQTNSLAKHYIKRYKHSQERTLKNCEANKFSKNTIVLRFNPASSRLSIERRSGYVTLPW